MKTGTKVMLYAVAGLAFAHTFRASLAGQDAGEQEIQSSHPQLISFTPTSSDTCRIMTDIPYYPYTGEKPVKIASSSSAYAVDILDNCDRAYTDMEHQQVALDNDMREEQKSDDLRSVRGKAFLSALTLGVLKAG